MDEVKQAREQSVEVGLRVNIFENPIAGTGLIDQGVVIRITDQPINLDADHKLFGCKVKMVSSGQVEYRLIRGVVERNTTDKRQTNFRLSDYTRQQLDCILETYHMSNQSELATLLIDQAYHRMMEPKTKWIMSEVNNQGIWVGPSYDGVIYKDPEDLINDLREISPHDQYRLIKYDGKLSEIQVSDYEWIRLLRIKKSMG